MATFHFDLVSPEKVLFSGEVSQVDVPGSEGDFGVLAAHAPLVTTLRPGILVIYSERDAQRIVVDGGFAEVGPAGLTVLANLAVPVNEFDVAALAGMIKDTEEDVADEKDGWNRDKLAQKLDRLKALQEFRVVSAGGVRDVDFAVLSGEAQRIPFLTLPTVFAVPGLADELARNVVAELFLDFAELFDRADIGFLIELA